MKYFTFIFIVSYSLIISSSLLGQKARIAKILKETKSIPNDYNGVPKKDWIKMTYSLDVPNKQGELELNIGPTHYSNNYNNNISNKYLGLNKEKNTFFYITYIEPTYDFPVRQMEINAFEFQVYGYNGINKTKLSIVDSDNNNYPYFDASQWTFDSFDGTTINLNNNGILREIIRSSNKDGSGHLFLFPEEYGD